MMPAIRAPAASDPRERETRPVWICMSSEICPDCRVRYLPIEGKCLCRKQQADRAAA
jgi:hypothetical protein